MCRTGGTPRPEAPETKRPPNLADRRPLEFGGDGQAELNCQPMGYENLTQPIPQSEQAGSAQTFRLKNKRFQALPSSRYQH